MKKIVLVCLLNLLSFAVLAQPKLKTFCNPLNLDYRFTRIAPPHRTAADPVITLYKNEYYLFATNALGYWRSPDLNDWTFIETKNLPHEKPAPAILILGDKMYYTAHRLKEIYETDNPGSGVWHKVADIGEYADPAFFLDDNNKLYLYFGSSLDGGISVVELDPKQNFKIVSEPVKLMNANSAEHGWEGSGEDNLGYIRNGVNRVEPYIEGSWMTKHNGKYYLQYSAPGTIWKTYADGIYTSKSPTKNFVYESYSPFSYKPGGFVGGAGHAGTFQDKSGNYWRVVTMIISVAHKFERRLGIFPAGFDADGVFRTNTYLGDYPQFLPGTAKNPLDENQTNWMLLSFGKKATASTSVGEHRVEKAFDEDIRTFWSAQTGDKNEWLQVDLNSISRINAVQINFAELEAKSSRSAKSNSQQYVLTASIDGKKWITLIDKSQSTRDMPHDYIQLENARDARFVRLTNVQTAADGTFAVRDLRVFGQALKQKPAAEVKEVSIRRNETDQRKIRLSWLATKNAKSYVVRFGISPEKLYNSFEVLDKTELVMNGLNKNVDYYFSVDAVNETGVTKGQSIFATTGKKLTIKLD